ncbi:hypothetical protein APR41_17695 [Salegentibacter salinarum]|uniref:Two-component system response regulator n=1 Tax=Salegentibacter salinarum TaxID=447422 RepID=A0A2N0TVF4_9FLAO|nr:LytTR family DNA-binding domain-containing protein [Salegentibacter salinarum]PKD18742.1 hypothetical protein APR41_17695 [Salegentibacter salinarum]SKB98565.1 two component transcriptional regulator, LytTR family [Salegentibacter salinarum]
MGFTYSIISDDAELISKLLELPIDFKEFTCVGYTGNGERACDIILQSKPQFVFIDLDNPRINDPFSFVNQFYQFLEVLPSFIAISASKNYAYEVIKNDFIDYLLKPLPLFELRKSLMRFKKKMTDSGQICLKSYSDYHFLKLKHILYLKADNNTTDFYLTSGDRVVAFKSLKIYQQLLPVEFVRVHKSYIVNSNLIRRINFAKNRISLEELVSVTEIPFSKKYQDNVTRLRDSFFKTNLSFD